MFPNTPRARITGTCYTCHTMHNSQGGVTMNGQATPLAALLRKDCVPCHTDSTTSTIVNSTPIVYNNNLAPINPLAGGNFYYVISDDDKGHNVLAGNPDPLTTPPGGSYPGSGSGQINCAGTNGCHGHNGGQPGDSAEANQLIAIRGGHHGNDTPPLGGSITDMGRNYRILLGIAGKEDANWEQDNTNTSHNEYRGGSGFGITNTVSYFCGECHGDYHSTSGVSSASPWLRHPTDYVIPSSGEYASYTTYSMTAPPARPDPDNVPSTSTVYPNTDTVMCLSCHRAHASPYYRAVRWDYKSTALATAISGCNVCHTSKN